ncbi:hypothetical protein ANN_04187 [Periplaneta americana]|uniref:WW domain-containing protein n=1 Tax=Periplaneta americana TaxID=6978 RepID=A0ABQ8T8L3_PERAM|nr:hypothetical protein ANN_04187 [Periplaneta americana]
MAGSCQGGNEPPGSLKAMVTELAVESKMEESRKLWSRDVEWPLGRGFYYHVITGRHVWTSDRHDASGEDSA